MKESFAVGVRLSLLEGRLWWPASAMWFTYGQTLRPWATVRDHWMRGEVLSKSNQLLHWEDLLTLQRKGTVYAATQDGQWKKKKVKHLLSSLSSNIGGREREQVSSFIKRSIYTSTLELSLFKTLVFTAGLDEACQTHRIIYCSTLSPSSKLA